MYSKTISHTVSAVTPLVAAIALAMPASAQDLALEEVVVTAQKRVQSLMDVPLSVSAVSGAKMQLGSLIFRAVGSCGTII